MILTFRAMARLLRFCRNCIFVLLSVGWWWSVPMVEAARDSVRSRSGRGGGLFNSAGQNLRPCPEDLDFSLHGCTCKQLDVRGTLEIMCDGTDAEQVKILFDKARRLGRPVEWVIQFCFLFFVFLFLTTTSSNSTTRCTLRQFLSYYSSSYSRLLRLRVVKRCAKEEEKKRKKKKENIIHAPFTFQLLLLLK